VIQASLRVVAPTMTFILLIGLAQMLFGKLPRVACAVVGAILFPLSAVVDPIFEGSIRIQPVHPVDLFWLVACGAIAGYLGGVLLAGLFLVADQLRMLRGDAVYAVPRRFGTGTLLVATTLFALLFAALQWAQARPEQLFFYTVASMGVDLSRWLLPATVGEHHSLDARPRNVARCRTPGDDRMDHHRAVYRLPWGRFGGRHFPGQRLPGETDPGTSKGFQYAE
jgi:hypothetical protein